MDVKDDKCTQLELPFFAELTKDEAPNPAAPKPWAWLLRHVLAIDVTTCPKCEGRMRWLETATTPKRSLASSLRTVSDRGRRRRRELLEDSSRSASARKRCPPRRRDTIARKVDIHPRVGNATVVLARPTSHARNRSSPVTSTGSRALAPHCLRLRCAKVPHGMS